LLQAATAWIVLPSLSKKSTTRKQPSRSSKFLVAAAFDTYPRRLCAKLGVLRKLILDTAKASDGVGAIEETLKWEQVSFLTSETKSGTTIQIDRMKSDPDRYALYLHCQTNLIDIFREIYPELTYGGNRCILIDAAEDMPKDALRHCVGLALTYHRDKNRHAPATRGSQSAGWSAPRTIKARRAS
jgi:hypothetical protein